MSDDSAGMPRRYWQQRWVGAVGLVAGVAGLWVLREYAPTDQSFFPKCVLHQWTGLHCPGCGSTRACHALLHGRWTDAVRFNPMLIIGGPIIAGVLFVKSRRERAGQAVMWRTSVTLATIILIYFVARNVPSPTTSPLAPPVIELVPVIKSVPVIESATRDRIGDP